MTNFRTVPYREVTIRSHMRYKNAHEFARAVTAPIPKGQVDKIGSLFWANGIVFRHFTFAASDSLTKEYLSGHLPIDHIEYAPMPQFQHEIQGDGIAITLIDASNHLLFNELTAWIKTKLEKQKIKK